MLGDAVMKAVPPLALGLVVAGGVLYSLGVIFHAWQRLRFQNAIWAWLRLARRRVPLYGYSRYDDLDVKS